MSLDRKLTPRRVEFEAVGPATLHDILCWTCNANRPAVYDVNARTFKPCWECQAADSFKKPAKDAQGGIRCRECGRWNR